MTSYHPSTGTRLDVGIPTDAGPRVTGYCVPVSQRSMDIVILNGLTMEFEDYRPAIARLRSRFARLQPSPSGIDSLRRRQS